MESVRIGAIRSCAFPHKHDAPDYFEADAWLSAMGVSMRLDLGPFGKRLWRTGGAAGHRVLQERAHISDVSLGYYAVFRLVALDTTEIGLLRAIITDDRADSALVYSDWLEERGRCKECLYLRRFLNMHAKSKQPPGTVSRYVARRFVNMAEHGFGRRQPRQLCLRCGDRPKERGDALGWCYLCARNNQRLLPS